MSNHWDDLTDRPPEPEPEPAKDAEDRKAKPSAATEIIRLAMDRYELGISDGGEPYAVEREGPRIARMLRGGSRSLRAEMAAAYCEGGRRTASQQALTDALLALEGQALAASPERLHLRVAEHGGALWLDLGDDTGRVVRIDAAGWRIETSAPMLFRRTALTGPLPEPARGGDLKELWALLNVAEDSQAHVLAYEVAALMPAVPHPVLALLGEHGTAKTSASRMLSGLIDPSPAQVRKAPRDAEGWVTAAAGSWVVALDNLSGLPDWLSDSLCRAVTGDGDVRRKLYSDADLAVFSFRRVILLNGIDLGALRDDLADRLLTVDLDLIPEEARLKDADVAGRWAEAHPRILGALLDLAVEVLRVLPGIHLPKVPRMADFAYVLAAVDQVQGTAGLAGYRELADDLAADSVTGDPVLNALAGKITTTWTGTAADLLAKISPTWPPDGWPKNARAMTAILRRRAPSLRRVGWQVKDLGRSGHGKVVHFQLVPPGADDGAGDSVDEGAVARTTPASPAPFTLSPASSHPPWPAETVKSASDAGDAGDRRPPSLAATWMKAETGAHEREGRKSSPATPASPAIDLGYCRKCGHDITVAGASCRRTKACREAS